MQELISFFIKLGMTQEQAARQAQDMLSRPHSFSSPSAVAARTSMENVYKPAPDAMEQLLTEKYGLDPALAKSYAQDVISGRASNADALKSEALSRVADQTVANARAVGHFAGATKRMAKGRTLGNEDLQYLRVGHLKEQERIKNEAASLAAEKLSSIGYQEEGRLHNMGQMAANPGLAALGNDGMTLRYSRPYPGSQ